MHTFSNQRIIVFNNEDFKIIQSNPDEVFRRNHPAPIHVVLNVTFSACIDFPSHYLCLFWSSDMCQSRKLLIGLRNGQLLLRLAFPPDSADRARLRSLAKLLHLDPLHVLHVVVDHLQKSNTKQQRKTGSKCFSFYTITTFHISSSFPPHLGVSLVQGVVFLLELQFSLF